MIKSKSKFVKLLAAAVLGISMFAAVSISYTTVAAAKTTYKISNNILVNAKTRKAVKGYVTYNSRLYKDGKLYTGIYHSIYYTAGVKLNGLKSGKLYQSGKLVSTYTLYNGRLYKKGGFLNTGLVLYSGKLYNGSVYNRGYALYGGKLYNGYAFNKSYALYGSKLYNGSALNQGFVLYGGKLYNGSALNQDNALYGGKLYKGSGLNSGFATFDNKLYNGYAPFTGLYKDGVRYTAGVAAADVKAPVITLPNSGQTAYTVAINDDTFIVPSATAADDRDKTMSVTGTIKDAAGQTVTAIDTTKAGSYTITYTAVDSAGNNADEKTITVTVEDSFEVIGIE